MRIMAFKPSRPLAEARPREWGRMRRPGPGSRRERSRSIGADIWQHDPPSRRPRVRIDPPHPSPFQARVETIGGEDRALLIVLIVAAVLMLASESLWALMPEF